MIAKGDIVRGAYAFLGIWGITSEATPEEIRLGIDTLDDVATQLESAGLMTGYHVAPSYGKSQPDDNSGLADWMAGPFKKILAFEMLSHYGKQPSQASMKVYDDGMNSLRHALVIVPAAQNPGTLPKGSGNEWAYRDNKFYSEPADTLDTETDGSIDDVTIDNADNRFINSNC